MKKGFATIYIIIIAILAALAGGGVYLMQKSIQKTTPEDQSSFRETKSVSPQPKDKTDDAARKPKNEIYCIQIYDPVCGVDGKTYSNECFAKVAGVAIKYKGECKMTSTPAPDQKSETQTTTKPPADETPTVESPTVESNAPNSTTESASPAPPVTELTYEADDAGFYPNQHIEVTAGSRVRLTLKVRSAGVYFGGLEFRSPKFNTGALKPGKSTTVEFTADQEFIITSYWPASGVKKADLRVILKE